MKKIFLAIVVTVMALGAYAQTDTSNKKMSPPDFNDNTNGELNRNKTNDGMNKSLDEKDIQNPNGSSINTDMEENPDKTSITTIPNQTNSDGVIMKDGKMMRMKSGQTTPMIKEITMTNGTKVMSNATIVQKDGTRMRLKEGQHIDMAGMITPVNDSEMKKIDDSKKLKQ